MKKIFMILAIAVMLVQNAPASDWKEELLDKSSQVILVQSEGPGVTIGTVALLEKNKKGQWEYKMRPFEGNVGRNGIAPVGEKREGDGRTPAGIFELKRSFGYPDKIDTMMAYHQLTENDCWVEDPKSDHYNKWLDYIPTENLSIDRMQREKSGAQPTNLYKYGVVIEYNTDPIVKGNGSAIFFHIWRGQGMPTAGCVSMTEEKIAELLKMLDPKKNPITIIGTADEVSSVKAIKVKEEKKEEKKKKEPPIGC